MTDPERWLGSPDAPEGMGELLSAAQTTVPTAAQKAAVAAKLGVGVTGLAALPVLKLLTVGAVVAGGAWWGVAAMNEPTPEASTNSSPVVEPSTQPAALDATPEVEAPKEPEIEAQQASLAQESKELPSKATQKARANPQVASEASLIRQAKSALDKSPHWALSLLSQHETHYPSGVLAEERELLKLRALKNLGQAKAAAQQAEKFRKDHPDSVHHVP